MPHNSLGNPEVFGDVYNNFCSPTEVSFKRYPLVFDFQNHTLSKAKIPSVHQSVDFESYTPEYCLNLPFVFKETNASSTNITFPRSVGPSSVEISNPTID